MSGGYTGVKIDIVGALEWHPEEAKKQIKKLIIGAKIHYKELATHTCSPSVVEREAIQCMKSVNKSTYYMASAYKRACSKAVKEGIPPMKQNQMKQIVVDSTCKLAQLLQKIAGQSVQDGFKDALNKFTKEAEAEFHKSVWASIGTFLADVGKTIGAFLTFGYSAAFDVEPEIAAKFAQELQRTGVVAKAVDRFDCLLDQQEETIIEYVKTKVMNAKPVEPEVDLVWISEKDKKAKHFAPWEGVLWHDTNIGNSENKCYCMKLTETYRELFYGCDSPDDAVKHIEEKPFTSFTVITAGKGGRVLSEQIRHKINVKRIVVFCGNLEFHKTWAEPWDIEVTNDFESLLEALTNVPELPPASLMAVEDLQKRVQDGMRISQHSTVQEFADNLDTKECVRELIVQRDGSATDSEVNSMTTSLTGSAEAGMRLWSGESFCYQLTRSMRTARRDMRLLKICRLAEHMACHLTALSKDSKYRFKGHVFRGIKCRSRRSLEQYLKSKGQVVFFRECMATSIKESVAIRFQGNAEFKVMLKIDATTIPDEAVFPIMIENMSEFASESEVLFQLFSAFEVRDVQPSADGKSATLDLIYRGAVPDPTAAFIYAFL